MMDSEPAWCYVGPALARGLQWFGDDWSHAVVVVDHLGGTRGEGRYWPEPSLGGLSGTGRCGGVR